MPQMRKVIMFQDGRFAVLDELGQQIPALQQRTAVELLGEYALAAGYDIEGCEFTTYQGTGHLIGQIGEVVESWDKTA